ncbi:unnamed protein product [Timema podura]|uniref:NUDE domain-containing protein n=1 Tax=Timema podura TaxID=61482 RepID=A0ABN7NJ26_TIMPD|nr:unnamed protein product [Timema podura]
MFVQFFRLRRLGVPEPHFNFGVATTLHSGTGLKLLGLGIIFISHPGYVRSYLEFCLAPRAAAKFARPLSHFCIELDDARDEKRQVERDLEEFQENSQQLEKELETSLEQAEKTTRDLRTRNNRLQLDNDTIRDKFEHLQRQSNMQILELQTSVSEYNNRQETLVKYIRELEQKNDDLERANRAMMTSLGESETKLNTAIERNAILEVEQDETKSILQRLKDESRDLLQEMKIRGPQIPDNDKSLERVCSPIDSNKLTVEIQTQTGIPGSPLKSKLNKAYRRTRDVGRALSCVGRSAH